jgi:hypothetical protein
MASPLARPRLQERLRPPRFVSAASARLRARPSLVAAVSLALLWAVAGVALAVWYSGRIRDWAVMTDELQYEELASAIAATGSPLPAIHGTAVSISNQLYPLLIAPFYGLLSPPSAFRGAHVLNALLMASAAVPAYLLGRQVLSRPWAFAAAALSVVLPWLVLAGFLMSEAAAYPAFLWAVLGLQLAVAAPGYRNDLVAVAALALAILARVQFAALVAVLPLAILSHEIWRELTSGSAVPWWRSVLHGARHAVARHLVLTALYTLALSAALGAAVVDSAGSLLGAYSVTLEEGSLLPADVWSAAAEHIDTVAIGSALVPLVLGGGWMLAAAVRPRSAEEHALAVLSLLTVVALTFETASYDLRFGGDGIVRDRYLFYVVPLLLVGMAAALSVAPRRPVAAGAAGVAVFFAATVPLLSFTTFEGLSVDSPASVVNGVLEDASGGLSTGAFVALAGLLVGAVLVLGVLFAPRLPFALLVVTAVLASSALLLREGVDRALESTAPSGRPLAGPPGVVLDWVDSVLPPEATAATIPFPVSTEWHLSAIKWWDVEFWNETVTRSYVAPDGNYTYTPFPVLTLSADWTTGRVADTADAPPFVVTAPGDPRFRLAGRRHATNLGLDVTAVDRPYRMDWATQGLDTDGWTKRGRPATIRVYGPSGEETRLYDVEVTVLAPPGPALYRITAPDDARAGPLFAGTDRTEVVSLCVPSGSSADVTVTGWSNARIPGPPLATPVERPHLVGVGITSVTVRPTDRDCLDERPE